MPAGGSATGKGDRRRGEILGAARAILVEQGYDRFVMREVAARVGVTLGNLQYYFATRDDLLEAVVREEFARNRSEVSALAAKHDDPARRLAAVARHLIDVWAHGGGRVYAVMSLLALHNERFRDLHREIYERFYADLVPVLRELQPGRKRASLLRLARIITTMIDGALVQLPSRTFAAEAVEAILRLAAPEPGSTRRGSHGATPRAATRRT